jgi:cytochrome c6
METLAFVLAGLTTAHKIDLAIVAAAFIVFSLVSSFVLPRRNANFPGDALRWYVPLCILFFVAMVSAVIIFGREKKEPATTSAAPPTSTSTAPSSSSSSGAVQGSPTAGKKVFLTAGCSNCHTLKAAKSHGQIGPNLDQLKPAYATVVHQVTHGGGVMPAFKGTLSPTQIQDVAAFVYTSTHS